MNINTDTMNKVHDVNKRSHSPDLKYSNETERWTMNEKIQDALNLDDSRGLIMYTAQNDEGENVVLVEIVDSDDAEFFKGKGNVFIARRLADAIDHHSFALIPANNMNGEYYVLQEWEGESQILNDDDLFGNNDTSETTEKIATDLSSEINDEEEEDVEFNYDMSSENEDTTLPA